MNAKIELAIIELESIVNHADFLTKAHDARKCYAVAIPAHMHVSIVDVKELINGGMNGLKRDMALVEAEYIVKRISDVISGCVKGTHVTGTGLRHLMNACQDFIEHLRDWAK